MEAYDDRFACASRRRRLNLMRIRKAVFPVAGLGTRFLPATKAIPKEMLPVVDKPAIEYVVTEAVEAGLTDVLMITGRNKRALEDHFDRNTELENEIENIRLILDNVIVGFPCDEGYIKAI